MKFYVVGYTTICWHIAGLIKNEKKIDTLNVDPYPPTCKQSTKALQSKHRRMKHMFYAEHSFSVQLMDFKIWHS
jgi:hypothetical protein